MSPSAWMLYFWSQQTYEGVFELTLQEIFTEKSYISLRLQLSKIILQIWNYFGR